MNNWNQGYVTDITYTKGYYGMLNPLRIKLCFLSQGLLPPKIKNACELGFGQGITLNFNAIGSNANWYGTDFNSSQAFFAKHLSEISQAPLKIYDDSFGEFLQRDDLPQFDYIALHGIYSWVNDEIQNQIIEFIRKKLNVGGVCLISYNCQPGWASIAPLRDLVRTYSNNLTPLGKPSSNRAQEGLEFINTLMSLPFAETLKSARMNSLLSTISGMDSTYLAHELLNDNHHPYNFFEMSEALSKAKLNFATYAHFHDHLIGIQILPEEQELLSRIFNNRPIYEMLKDLMFSTSFRADYWAKGIVQLNPQEAMQELSKLKIVLSTPFSKIDYQIKTYRGTFQLNQDFYSPLLETLKDHESVEISAIKAKLETSLKRQITFAEISEALIALSSKGCIQLVQNDEEIQSAKIYAKNINTYILKQSIETQDCINHLISPVTGEAFTLNRFRMTLLYAHTLFKEEEKQINFVLETLQKNSEKVTKEGKELSNEEIQKELKDIVEDFRAWIPVFKKLQIL